MSHKIQISGSQNKLKTSKNSNTENNPNNWAAKGLNPSAVHLLELGLPLQAVRVTRAFCSPPGLSACPRPAPLLGRPCLAPVAPPLHVGQGPFHFSQTSPKGWILMNKFTVLCWLSPVLQREVWPVQLTWTPGLCTPALSGLSFSIASSEKPSPTACRKLFHFILCYFLPITAHHLKGPHLFVCSLSLPQWNVHPRTAGADPILFAAASPEPGTVLNEYTDESEWNE